MKRMVTYAMVKEFNICLLDVGQFSSDYTTYFFSTIPWSLEWECKIPITTSRICCGWLTVYLYSTTRKERKQNKKGMLKNERRN
ncbi:hypothetical protein Glove_66g73 [Diversispora epigaea]|uniref:Uncharacterized protein n=1 Tax=Diversispora epigaea TaxID=1348612 RepID=A0A397JAM3_9GLOM|nr:hypothetical protein Glove_66g73 [Diversispora epigaea]